MITEAQQVPMTEAERQAWWNLRPARHQHVQEAITGVLNTCVEPFDIGALRKALEPVQRACGCWIETEIEDSSGELIIRITPHERGRA